MPTKYITRMVKEMSDTTQSGRMPRPALLSWTYLNRDGEYTAKAPNCIRGRIAQARARNHGFNPCSAETG